MVYTIPINRLSTYLLARNDPDVFHSCKLWVGRRKGIGGLDP
jgi:hypothetical protein